MALRPGQRVDFALLLGWNFCAVAALAIGRTVSNALFLAHETAARQPLMFVVSPLVVTAVGLGHAAVADRVRRPVLVTATPLVLALLVGAAWHALGPRWLYYALYAGVEVIVSLTMIQFWTSAGERFSPREARQVFSRMAIGGTVANIILGFVMSALVRRTGLNVWLLVTAGFLGVVSVLAGILARRPGARPPAPRPTFTPGAPPVDPPGTGHLVLLGPMIACTVLATTLMEFQFKTLGGQSFGGDREAWGHFLGQLQGAMGLLSLFMQLFVTGRVLERVGVTGALMFMPGTLGLSAAGILVSPTLAPATLSEFGDVFRFTVHDAAMQLLYLPVPSAVRGRRKATIDGVIKPVTEALSGGGLLAYQHIVGAAIAPLAWASVVVVGVYFSLVVRMRGAYVRSLAETLRRRPLVSVDAVDVTAQDVDRAVRSALAGTDPVSLRRALDVARLAPGTLVQAIQPLTHHPDAGVRAQALAALAAGGLPVDDATRVRALADADADVRAAGCRVAGHDGWSRVVALLDDPEPTVVAAAAETVYRHGDATARAAVLLRVTAMLSAAQSAARQRGLALVPRMADPGLLPAVIGCLADRRDGVLAVDAAVAVGPVGEAALLAAADDPVRAPMAVRALAGLGTPTAMARVIAAVRASGEAERDAACEALARARVTTGSAVAPTHVLVTACRAELTRAYEAIAAAESLGRAESTLLPDGSRRRVPYLPATADGPAALISRALRERSERARDRVLYLLGALQPELQVETIRANLQEPDPVRRANAVELLEAVGWRGETARLKALVLALVDESPRASKLAAARVLSLPSRTRDATVALLLNDPAPWMAACAGYYAGAAGVVSARATVQALTTDARTVVRETAVAALAALDADDNDRDAHAKEAMITTAEKVLFLKGIELFAAVPSEDLAALAGITHETHAEPEETVFREGDRGDALYLVVEGRVKVTQGGRSLAVLAEREVFGEMALLDPAPRSATATAETAVTLLRIGQDDFHDVLRARPDVAEGVLRVMTRRLRAANLQAARAADAAS